MPAFAPLLTNTPSRKVEYTETVFTVDTTNMSLLKSYPPTGCHLDSFTLAHTIKVQHRTSQSHPVIREKPPNTSSIVCFLSCCFNKGRCEKEERMPLFNSLCRLKPQGHASGHATLSGGFCLKDAGGGGRLTSAESSSC